MKKTLLASGLILAFITAVISADTAQYIGSSKCKMCHMSKKRGDQWNKWLNGPHAKAFEVLATDEAKAVAKEAGLSTDPQQAAECLVCHVTAFDAPASAKADSYTQEEGVGCESCHGPGSLYKSMKVMKALTAGEQDPKAVSFISGDEETCLTCHNEKSPTYKPFVYTEAWKQIAHPIPAE